MSKTKASFLNNCKGVILSGYLTIHICHYLIYLSNTGTIDRSVASKIITWRGGIVSVIMSGNKRPKEGGIKTSAVNIDRNFPKFSWY